MHKPDSGLCIMLVYAHVTSLLRLLVNCKLIPVLCMHPPGNESQINANSRFITRAELFSRGSEVTITCEFTDDYPEASCVLVYREYNDPYLTVEEYDRSTEFPVTIFVSSGQPYTFAVFGKNRMNGIEAEPVITLKEEGHAAYMSPATGIK